MRRQAVFLEVRKKITTKQLIDLYEKHYENERFVRISQEKVYPSTNQVRGSNYCDIGIKVNSSNNTAVIVSVIDNLVKGASGQAVQNMNVMMGYEETTGLETTPVFP